MDPTGEKSHNNYFNFGFSAEHQVLPALHCAAWRMGVAMCHKRVASGIDNGQRIGQHIVLCAERAHLWLLCQRLERPLAPSEACTEQNQTIVDEKDNIYVKLELWRLEGVHGLRAAMPQSLVYLMQCYAGEDRERWLPYNSKETTGYVGFDNQGATCYMNSLLQTLYHLTEFRRTVYAIPTEDVEAVVSQSDGKRSIVLALQRVFFSLQNQSRAVRYSTQLFGK